MLLRKSCTPLDSLCISQRTLAKCQCHVHYNFKVFPLPVKITSFFVLIYITETNAKKKTPKKPCACHNSAFLISVILHWFSKIWPRSTKKLVVFFFFLARVFFQAKRTERKTSELCFTWVWKTNRQKGLWFHCNQLALTPISNALCLNPLYTITEMLQKCQPHCRNVSNVQLCFFSLGSELKNICFVKTTP